MDCELDLSIRHKLLDCLTGALSLSEFQDWFVEAAHNAHKSADIGGAALAAEIELALAEYSSGHRTEPELRGILSRLVYSVSGCAIGSTDIASTDIVSDSIILAPESRNISVDIRF